MKCKLLLSIFLIGVLNNANAQLNPTETFPGYVERGIGNGFAISNFYTYSNSLAYSIEIQGADIEFSLYNDELSLDRTIKLKDVFETLDYGDYKEGASRLLGIENPYDGQGLYEHDLLFTQTFFNDDEKLEFIIATHEKKNDGGYSFYIVKTLDIVSEDGSILATIPNPFPDKMQYTYLETFQLNDNKYLVLMSYRDNYSCDYACYKINNIGGSSLSVQQVPASFAFPNPVSRHQMITISMADTQLPAGSYVKVTDMTGKEVVRQQIQQGSENVLISGNRFSGGQYIYTVVANGQIIDKGKLLVK